MKLRKVLRDKKGNSTPLTIALVLGLLLLTCAMAEFFRLAIIVQGVRDGLQQSVVSVMTTNYDEAYNGLREGYSGGYYLNGEHWEENLDYDDVYYSLRSLLGLSRQNGYYQKTMGNSYEYRLSGLDVEIENVPLRSSASGRNLNADARITIEIPLSFGWQSVPPLTMQIRTKAAYMPKF